MWVILIAEFLSWDLYIQSACEVLQPSWRYNILRILGSILEECCEFPFRCDVFAVVFFRNTYSRSTQPLGGMPAETTGSLCARRLLVAQLRKGQSEIPHCLCTGTQTRMPVLTSSSRPHRSSRWHAEPQSPVGGGEAWWDGVAIASSRKERKLSPDPLRLKTSDGLQGMTRGRGWVKGGETAWVVLESNKLQDSGERE